MAQTDPMAKPQALQIGGRTIQLTNPDKVMYPATGTTKGEVVDYYRAIADTFVPQVAGRPATRKRWVNGVDAHAFFSKNADSGTPDWVRTVVIPHRGRDVAYPIVDDAATLVWLAQLAALEIHVPQWRFDADDRPQHPDRLVLDLDPGEGATLDDCVRLALVVKEIIDGVGLTSVPVTSGSKGIHIYAGLDGHLTSGDASDFARQLAVALEGTHPDLVVSDMKKELRGGKILLDWSQNNGSKTTVAPYSLRGRDMPWVAAPRDWDEIAPGLEQLTFSAVLERLASGIEPLAALLPDRATAPVGSVDRQARAAADDRLDTYRAKRDAAKTPEPVPEAGESPAYETGGNSFVIQEHHARRLHHDFRLEHDGVLVSWAVPKLTPLTTQGNHLAVQTEDHPLEYGTFEGTIPAGEYGGGEVTIWDSGTYELEKWNDREVMARLHGRPDGGLGGVPRRYVLIHTGHGDDPKNWLIHLMAPETPAWGLADLPNPEAMLATLADENDARGDGWHYEVKWDGYRGIARVAGDAWTLGSRKGLDFTATYPELRELADRLAGHAAVLDGEIVALGPDGRSHFELLQNHGKGAASAHYMVFDLVWLDGESLLERPYVERRAALEELLPGDGRFVHVPTTFGTDRELALATSRQLKLEGVIAKRAESTYAAGRRSRAWLKLKNVRMQDVVVVGWSPGEGNRAGKIGSLLLAVNGPDGLEYVGHAGSGFTERSLAEAMKKLAPLERATPALPGIPRADARAAHWVEPVLVGEVKYGEWTASGHVRHPVWRGWRPDKDAAEVVRED